MKIFFSSIVVLLMFISCLSIEMNAQVKTCVSQSSAIPVKYGQPDMTVDLGAEDGHLYLILNKL